VSRAKILALSLVATNIKVPTLVLYAPTDQIFAESSIRETIQKIGAAGASVDSATLMGSNGHLNAITEIGQAANKISVFLSAGR
jgi:homoserine O-acetyltransferase/O-succinyltransferase